nr:MAG TPA: hypothetical protein [Bacteriophage sp.]
MIYLIGHGHINSGFNKFTVDTAILFCYNVIND